MENIKSGIERILDGIMQRDGSPHACCETGDEYITLTSSGSKKEGSLNTGFETKEMAVVKYLEELSQYIKNKQDKIGVLYWRRYPEIQESNGRWYVKSRLVYV